MDFPRLSQKEYHILDLLSSETELLGLEIVKKSGGILRRGTVYITLLRMVEKGYLKSRQEENPSVEGIPRRLYSITAEGARILQIRNVRFYDRGILTPAVEAWL